MKNLVVLMFGIAITAALIEKGANQRLRPMAKLGKVSGREDGGKLHV